MQLSQEEYARKRIYNGSSVQIENSVTRVTVRHHSASLVMPNSYPSDGILNQHLTTIEDSYNPYHSILLPTGMGGKLKNPLELYCTFEPIHDWLVVVDLSQFKTKPTKWLV